MCIRHPYLRIIIPLCVQDTKSLPKAIPTSSPPVHANGYPILFNETIFTIILDSLKYCQANKGLRIHGYVIMINHLHAIISHEYYDQIPNVIRDFKRHTATEIKDYLEGLGSFSQLFWIKRFHNQERGDNRIWQEGYHPLAVKSGAFFRQKLNYIHFNPVEKGFVTQPEHWKYSSARNYLLGDDSFLMIDRVESD